MAASAELELGRYGGCCYWYRAKKNVPAEEAANNIGGPAMWSGRECQGIQYPWPHMFSLLTDEYDKRYGIMKIIYREFQKLILQMQRKIQTHKHVGGHLRVNLFHGMINIIQLLRVELEKLIVVKLPMEQPLFFLQMKVEQKNMLKIII